MKESNLKKLYTLYDPKYRTFWKKQNYGDNKKISGCKEVRKEVTNREQRIFKAKILGCHKDLSMSSYICPNPDNVHQKVNPNVNYGLWVIMICPFKSISCNKCNTLVRDVGNGGSYACVQTGGIWDNSVPFPQFCCKAKTAL